MAIHEQHSPYRSRFERPVREVEAEWRTVGEKAFFSWSIPVREELIEKLGDCINCDGGWWGVTSIHDSFSAAGIIYHVTNRHSQLENMGLIRESLEQNYKHLSMKAKQELAVYGRVAFSQMFVKSLRKRAGVDVYNCRVWS